MNLKEIIEFRERKVSSDYRGWYTELRAVIHIMKQEIFDEDMDPVILERIKLNMAQKIYEDLYGDIIKETFKIKSKLLENFGNSYTYETIVNLFDGLLKTLQP